jgi:thioredoxin reductase (NADPH)
MDKPHDVIVIGAGPTGIAIGAEARRAGLNVLLIDRGHLTQALLDFPTYMTFFTTRDKLEIAGIPFCVPDEKPTRQQALVYYRSIVDSYKIPLALHEEVLLARRTGEVFRIESRREGKRIERQARAAAFATGYYDHPFKLNVPGAHLPWVHSYYDDPYHHYGEHVVLVGGGNSACEAALDLWRNGARSVTLIVRDSRLKEGVKYWVRPDVENRIAEGAIQAHFNAVALGFHDNPREVEVRLAAGHVTRLPADTAFVLIGFIQTPNCCGAAESRSMKPRLSRP